MGSFLLIFYFCFFLLALEFFQQVVGEGLAGGPVPVSGDDNTPFCLHTGTERRSKFVRFLRHGDVPEHQFSRLQDAGRIGIVPFAGLNLSGCRAVDGLKHGILAADVGTSGGPDPSLNLCCFVGDDIPVKIGQQKDLELAPNRRIHETCRRFSS